MSSNLEILNEFNIAATIMLLKHVYSKEELNEFIDKWQSDMKANNKKKIEELSDTTSAETFLLSVMGTNREKLIEQYDKNVDTVYTAIKEILNK